MAYKHILIAVDLSPEAKFWLKKRSLWRGLTMLKFPLSTLT